MGEQTLFGPADDIAPPRGPRQPAPPRVVNQLVALGVDRREAEEWEGPKAFAVLDRMRNRPAKVARPPVPPPDESAPAPDRGGSQPERAAAAVDVAELLHEAVEDASVPWEQSCDRLAACLYVLSRAEFARVSRGVIKLMAGELPPPVATAEQPPADGPAGGLAIRDAQAIAYRLRRPGVIVLTFGADGFEGSSYGMTRDLCRKYGRVLEAICDALTAGVIPVPP
jgi:hypothetical protein